MLIPIARHVARGAAGALLVVAGAGILMGIITAEALYPAPYSTGESMISDLGATEPPDSVILQPSAAIFDTTMAVAGALVLAAAALAYRATGRRRLAIPLAILGVGILGVGLFPGDTAPHPLFAQVAFIGGGVAAVLSGGVLGGAMGWISRALGTITLVSLALAITLLDWGPVASLGEGGIERWIAYPVVLWLVALGGWLGAGDEGDRLGAAGGAVHLEGAARRERDTVGVALGTARGRPDPADPGGGPQ
jgi:hypothetical membrane protein